ncbi:ribonuclease III [Candidatus Woesebacteria bacterium RIFCSPHIGHO2_01_FULL_41_10]|uniref:Ribonuclease 3 n=1 Tax=Candidatus Woesebacteria bacterium RIFCSPHIGHO2_01_FULL_41_10 TaxID=1802500 RepID=A0A1F7YQH1_9BACT|nr:MAG: ribonuclease III [Candidatus Woesebacteria bacterium RIFCSPHIGHO2_01_FULL_41_10]
MKKELKTKTIEEIKKSFKDQELIEQALTHRSWINENKGARESYERLEFLGDAVLELVVSDRIYHELPERQEGSLTVLRSHIVNTKNLCAVAIKLGLDNALYLSRGEEQSGGRSKPALLADVVEAVIGALYLDQGFDIAREFVDKHVLDDLMEKLKEPLNAKSRLQELVQSQGMMAPKYKVIEEHGPDHDKEFIVEVVINGTAEATGKGRNKAEAEQSAAEAAYELVKDKLLR